MNAAERPGTGPTYCTGIRTGTGPGMNGVDR